MNVTRILIQVCLLCAAMLPAVAQAQFTFTTNNDGSLNISQYTGSNGIVVIPDTTNGLPVTSIGNEAFEGGFFITSVTIGTNVASIGAAAFRQCFSLTNITIPTTVNNIGNGAFEGSSLINVIIPNSVTNIGGWAFEDCYSLIGVTIGTNVISIGQQEFEDCSSLTNIIIPDSATSIGQWAFENCGLTNIIIGNGITSIGGDIFSGCLKLTNVTIGSGVTNIGDFAFAGCPLAIVTIPNSVTSIGEYAFFYCTSLNGVYFQGNAPSADYSVFQNDNNVTAYYLPGTTGWSDFAENTGVQTALWLPQAQTGDGSFGVQANQFGFNINWASGQTVVVEASTNLFNPVWQPVQTNTLTGGSSYFTDPHWTNYPGRYYRLRSQ